jgi:2-keto-4-pentenoate hydratase/2-oxohepta-3-ene-1,7-dioic acid hydratase in catechol pathway
MRICRFAVADQVAFGVVEGDGDTVVAIDGHPFGPFSLSTARFPRAEVRLLAPVLPSKIIGVGKNYADHAREMGSEPPTGPIFFLKPSTAVIGPGDAIVLPPESNEVHYEAELAVVIGRICRRVPVEGAAAAILGFTCANDVTARDFQRGDGQWTRAKGFDTFAPLGPWIETEADPGDLRVTCAVDGGLVQDGRTSAMLRSVAELVAAASAVMTLLPGDVLLTGTPAGVGPLAAGNTVDVTIEGLGTLSNPVIADD